MSLEVATKEPYFVEDFGDSSYTIVQRWGIEIGQDKCLCDFPHWNDPKLMEEAWGEACYVCELLNKAAGTDRSKEGG